MLDEIRSQEYKTCFDLISAQISDLRFDFMSVRGKYPTSLTTRNSLGRNISYFKLIKEYHLLKLDLKYELNYWLSSCTPTASFANNESFKLHVKIVHCFILDLYIGFSQ